MDCVQRQDIKAAAGIVFDALNKGVIDDQDELLEDIPDDVAREIVRLELGPMIEAQLAMLIAQIGEIWPENDD